MNPRPLKRSKTIRRYVRAAPRRTKSLSSVHPGQGLVAKKQTVLLRYADSFLLASGSTPTSRLFRVNGLFDPDAAVGGHQPRGFDQLAVLYKRYRVTKACLEVWTCPTSPSSECMTVVTMRNDNNPIPDTRNAIEDPECVLKMVASDRPAYIKKEIDLKKYMIDYDVDDYAATVSALPANQLFFHIVNCGVAGQNQQNNQIQIRITYEAEFFDPQLPSSS
uniref:Uncharacterized protein n=1 Tax=uncultured marine virus TaxID=186617 RepID=S4TFE2_9VIRU|nr:hypothetical protein [uncultured marine virus]